MLTVPLRGKLCVERVLCRRYPQVESCVCRGYCVDGPLLRARGVMALASYHASTRNRRGVHMYIYPEQVDRNSASVWGVLFLI